MNINPNFEDLNNPESFVNDIESKIGEVTANDINKLIESTWIDPAKELKPPQIAWEQIHDGESRILGTLGNFSMIIGKAKSRKSFFINIAVSAVLSDDVLLYQFKGRLPEDKKQVLYFDTEQSEYHVQKALKRICEQINEPIPTNLSVYGLRSLKTKQRLEVIDKLITDTPNLGFVVIDGIRDLLTSINDEAEATEMADKLLQWTANKNIHIVVVLHQNKSDNNARGHIGTELMNKAETTLSVAKSDNDKDISIVQAEYCRNREPEPFAFEIIDGLPLIVEDYEIRTKKATGKNSFSIEDIPSHEKFRLLTEAFSHGDEFSYTELRIQLQFAFKKKYDKRLSDNKAKELITHCRNKRWIIQEAPKKPYRIGQYET